MGLHVRAVTYGDEPKSGYLVVSAQIADYVRLIDGRGIRLSAHRFSHLHVVRARRFGHGLMIQVDRDWYPNIWDLTIGAIPWSGAMSPLYKVQSAADITVIADECVAVIRQDNLDAAPDTKVMGDAAKIACSYNAHFGRGGSERCRDQCGSKEGLIF